MTKNPKTIRVSAYLDEDAYQRTKEAAEKNGLGISSLVRFAVMKVLKTQTPSQDDRVPTR